MSDTLDEKRPTRGDARRDAIVQAARKVCLERLLQNHRFRHRKRSRYDAFAVLPLLRRQGSRS